MGNEQLKQRVENDFTYHAPVGDQVERYKLIRDEGKFMAGVLVNACPESRELSLALTKVEEAVMWANAAIARNEKPATDVEQPDAITMINDLLETDGLSDDERGFVESLAATYWAQQQPPAPHTATLRDIWDRHVGLVDMPTEAMPADLTDDRCPYCDWRLRKTFEHCDNDDCPSNIEQPEPQEPAVCCGGCGQELAADESSCGHDDCPSNR